MRIQFSLLELQREPLPHFPNTLITLLIIAYSPTASPSAVEATVLGMGETTAGLYSISKEQLALLQIATLSLSLFSSSHKSQIIGNARAGSTEQLSAVAAIAQVFGCLARLFRSSQEVNGRVVTAGFALGLVLNRGPDVDVLGSRHTG